MLKNIIDLINKRIVLFESFEQIYIFGSILQNNTKPKDIDILLLYSSYSKKLLVELKKIKHEFHSFQGTPFHFVALSLEEEAETSLLHRMNSTKLKIK